MIAPMMVRGLLVALALAACAAAAHGEPVDARAGAPRPAELPAVSSPAPPALAALDPLPPGIRGHGERAGLAWTAAGAGASRAAQLVEVIESPLPSAADWVSVEYTVDPDLDERVRSLLMREGVSLGHVVLMDPATGEILSYVSTDPQRFPATRPYPTASLMKVVTAAAVLRRAPEAATRDCRYVGSPYKMLAASLEPPARSGHVDSFWRSIAISNNQCFGRLAVHDLGEEALLEEIERLGLVESPGAHHAPGIVEPVDDALALGQLGSGLAHSFITPLAAVRLAAVLARGELVQPYWIARARDAYGNPLPVPGRAEPRPVWSPDVTQELRELLVGVTTRGTARRAFHDRRGAPLLGPIRVAGKTGSLSGSNPSGHYEWFIGVAPADAPRIAIATVVVDAAHFSSKASDLAAAVLGLVFCEPGPCEAAQVERLHARARARAAEAEAAHSREAQALAEASELDALPTPLGLHALELPRRLLEKRASGQIVLLVELDAAGEVVDVHVDSSDLPEFEDVVSEAVRGWRFTPPTRGGRPVRARARLPIPIRVN